MHAVARPRQSRTTTAPDGGDKRRRSFILPRATLYSQTVQAVRQAETGFDTSRVDGYPTPPRRKSTFVADEADFPPPPSSAMVARVGRSQPVVFSHEEVRVSEASTTNSTLRVLVVDPLEETRAVLETMLSRRGVRIVTTARRDEGLRLARDFQPDVIVLDCETPIVEPSDDGDSTADAGQSFESAAPDHPPSLVLIGSARRATNAGSARYLQKPYDYAPLIHTIEELLASRRAA